MHPTEDDDLDRQIVRAIELDDEREERQTWHLLRKLMKRGPAMTKQERGRYLLELFHGISKAASSDKGAALKP